MAKMRTLVLLAALLAAFSAECPAATECSCNLQDEEAMKARQCSLCREAEAQPADVKVFFVKDSNPNKSHRWLALPRAHWAANHEIAEMTAADRTLLWTTAIDKAKSLWGDEWGVAYNGLEVRTQCHAHIHIGKLLEGVETDKDFMVVNTPSEIPNIPGEGMWIHSVGNKLHVHLHVLRAELVLLR
jgi:hypothetical protein